jgi:hypothetical protein
MKILPFSSARLKFISFNLLGGYIAICIFSGSADLPERLSNPSGNSLGE